MFDDVGHVGERLLGERSQRLHVFEVDAAGAGAIDEFCFCRREVLTLERFVREIHHGLACGYPPLEIFAIHDAYIVNIRYCGLVGQALCRWPVRGERITIIMSAMMATSIKLLSMAEWPSALLN